MTPHVGLGNLILESLVVEQARLSSYNDNNDVSWEVDQFVSPTNSYLQIIAKEQEFNVGSVANFEIRSSKEIDQLSFMVRAATR